MTFFLSLVYSPYNRNNCSLFWIPDCVWNPHYVGEPDLTVWSCHTWKRIKPVRPSLQVLIRYSFPFDKERGFYRATVKNIWKRSDRLELYCKGKILLNSAFEDNRAEICERMKLLFNYDTLRDKPITRYRFNLIAASPEGHLNLKDGHHEADNINMRQLSAAYGRQLPDDWLKATDDRFKILSPEYRGPHKLIHFKKGDKSFYPFCRSEYDPIFDPEN